MALIIGASIQSPKLPRRNPHTLLEKSAEMLRVGNPQAIQKILALPAFCSMNERSFAA
jgi:hypothetical protein